MNYRALHRRLDEFKAKIDAIERARTFVERENLTQEEQSIRAEKARDMYQRLVKGVGCTDDTRKSPPGGAMEEYLRLVREPAPTPKKH